MDPIQFRHYKIVDSTNDIAIALAREGAPEGTVVIAEQQIKGRGRLGRSWWDKPGQSVLMSIVVTPDKSLSELYQLAFVAAVPVAECLIHRCDLDEVRIKWPNDILVRNRKIAGILVETITAGDKPAAVVGIGVNVHQREFPPEFAETATSLALEGSLCTEPVRLAGCLAESFFAIYNSYMLNGFEDILQHWQKYMWGTGRQITIRTDGKDISGEIWGVDNNGALLVKDAPGNIHPVHTVEAIHLDIDRSSQHTE